MLALYINISEQNCEMFVSFFQEKRKVRKAVELKKSTETSADAEKQKSVFVNSII